MQIHEIKLSRLTLSDLNVRKTERDADILSLAADIGERGLKQNLVVVQAEGGMFEVVAGGRRFQALKLLVEQDKFSDDQAIPCIIEEREGAIETSLSENLHRVAMNPADEFLAFKTIIDAAEGDDEERITYCAKRFGVTTSHVRGRLRLAGLSETILEALRTNVITLGSAMAYASVNDPEKQDKVFEKQSKSTWKPHDPDSVRTAMKDKTYSPTDSKVIYIGIENYKKRGGRIDADLFTVDHPERLIDTALVDEMVNEKFKKGSAKLAAKHGYADALLAGNNWDRPKREGYEAVWGREDDEVDNRHERIALFWLNHQGKLEMSNYELQPIKEVEDDDSTKETRNWEAEQEAARRARYIMLEQARLATTAARQGQFENRLFLPTPLSWIRFEEADDGSEFYVEVKLRLTKEELDAQLEAATAAYEQALVDKAERDAAVAAAREQAKKDREEMHAKILALDPQPSVVELDSDPGVFFRWADGSYCEMPEDDADEEDNFMESAANLEELIDGVDVLGFWSTTAEYEEALEKSQTVDA